MSYNGEPSTRIERTRETRRPRPPFTDSEDAAQARAYIEPPAAVLRKLPLADRVILHLLRRQEGKR